MLQMSQMCIALNNSLKFLCVSFCDVFVMMYMLTYFCTQKVGPKATVVVVVVISSLRVQKSIRLS